MAGPPDPGEIVHPMCVLEPAPSHAAPILNPVAFAGTATVVSCESDAVR
jgi:hypothetical protein